MNQTLPDRCRYSDCAQGYPVTQIGKGERVTCPICRAELGLVLLCEICNGDVVDNLCVDCGANNATN